MKRKVLYFRKQSHDVIQGVCQAGIQYIGIGQPCNTSGLHGGGFVDRMEMDELGNVAIYKRDAKGERSRNFGLVTVKDQKVALTGDCVLVPAVKLDCIVCVDDPADDIEQPAKVVPKGR